MGRGGREFKQVGVADERGDLGGHRDQHADFVLRKGARLHGLHHEDALQTAALHERHAEKRVIRVFAGLGKILETRM